MSPKLRGDHADSSLVVFSETFRGCTYSLESLAVLINVCFKIVRKYELLFHVCLANEDDYVATTSIPIQMDRSSWIRAQVPHFMTVWFAKKHEGIAIPEESDRWRLWGTVT